MQNSAKRTGAQFCTTTTCLHFDELKRIKRNYFLGTCSSSLIFNSSKKNFLQSVTFFCFGDSGRDDLTHFWVLWKNCQTMPTQHFDKILSSAFVQTLSRKVTKFLPLFYLNWATSFEEHQSLTIIRWKSIPECEVLISKASHFSFDKDISDELWKIEIIPRGFFFHVLGACHLSICGLFPTTTTSTTTRLKKVEKMLGTFQWCQSQAK